MFKNIDHGGLNSLIKLLHMTILSYRYGHIDMCCYRISISGGVLVHSYLTDKATLSLIINTGQLIFANYFVSEILEILSRSDYFIHSVIHDN